MRCHFELVIDDDLGFASNRCAPTWSLVYAWTGDGYKNVSDQFRDFYLDRLSSLEKLILNLPESGDSYIQKDKECLQAEAAKIKKFLQISPNAGLDAAERSANSKDPAQRETAAYLLGSMGTAEAQKYLEKLAKDPEAAVAYMDKYYLNIVLKSRIPITDEFERVQPNSIH